MDLLSESNSSETKLPSPISNFNHVVFAFSYSLSSGRGSRRPSKRHRRSAAARTRPELEEAEHFQAHDESRQNGNFCRRSSFGYILLHRGGGASVPEPSLSSRLEYPIYYVCLDLDCVS